MTECRCGVLKSLLVALMRKFSEGGVVTIENMLYDGAPRYDGEIGWTTVGDDVIVTYKEEERDEIQA